MAASERKNKITKYIIRTFATVLMIAAVVCSVLLMQHFLCIPGSYDDNRVLMLHKEPANTIDVLIIGSRYPARRALTGSRLSVTRFAHRALNL